MNAPVTTVFVGNISDKVADNVVRQFLMVNSRSFFFFFSFLLLGALALWHCVELEASSRSNRKASRCR